MDWTGGVRRRFAAGKKNSVLQKQKAHFAKARAASQTPNVFKARRLQDKHYSHGSHWRKDDTQSRTQHGNANAVEAPLKSESYHDEGRSFTRNKKSEIENRLYVSSTEKQRQDQESRSVIYISSSDGSDPARSLMVSHERLPAANASQLPTAHDNNMKVEDTLLLVNRRRLLARNDWLGLAHTRPVQIRFPSSQAKDRIGKRRKIRSSVSRKGQPAQQVCKAPFFNIPLPPHDHLESGALQADNIRIKIGIDAFASQTQASRHSQKSENTSLRPPQSGSSHLSEESMLLDGDEDTFESTLLPEVVQHDEASRPDRESHTALEGSQMIRPTHYVPERPEMRSLQLMHNRNMPFGLAKSPHACYNEWKITALEAAIDKPLVPIETEPRKMSTQLLQLADERTHERNVTQAEAQSAVNRSVDQDDDEQAYGRLMGISYDFSNASIAALKSSSTHLTTSDTSSCRLRCETSAKVQHVSETGVAPSDCGNQGTTLHGVPHRFTGKVAQGTPAELQSPSAPFQQPAQCVDGVAGRKQSVEEYEDDDALWREFVVGSQDSSDEVSQQNRNSTFEVNVDKDGAAIAPRLSAFALSGLGTSVKSTLGESQDLSTTNMSVVSDRDLRRKPEVNCYPISYARSAESAAEPRVAAEIDEVDSIEDSPPRVNRRSRENERQTRTTSILNPRRFKPLRTKSEVHERQRSRFHTARK